MTYDLNGNTLSDGMNAYVWDARNRLASANNNGATFAYDSLGRRTGKNILSANTNFLYDGANPVQELDGTNIIANLLTGSVDEYFARSDSSGTSNILSDVLGSTIALTDASGNSTAQYSYGPYGPISISGITNNSYTYTGREIDGLGLYFYRARYYDPRTGRFLGEDPEGFSGSGLNLYAYADESPTNFIDPLGNDVWIEGPSGSEPLFHLSINVGNPNGTYSSYSFRVNGEPYLQGEVYEDTEKGGPILSDNYLHTTATEDARVKALLDAELGKKSTYGPGNTCRDFSKKQFKRIKDLGIGKLGAPPSRTPVPMDWSPYRDRIQSGTNAVTPAHH